MAATTERKTFFQLLGERRWRSSWLRRWSRELVVAGALAMLTGFIWVANEGAWSAADWAAPVAYSGDSLQILGWITAAAEGDYSVFGLNFVRRLGAPYEANWNDYPMYEKPFTILLGQLARRLGAGAAANIGMLLVHMLATFSFYLSVRWFRWNRCWCGVAAMVFGLFYYIATRGSGHLLLALVYTLPPALLATWLLTASRRIWRYSPTWCLCVWVSFWMGISCPYYLNMYLQLLLLGMLMQGLTRRDADNLWAGVHCLVSSAAGFLLIHSGLLAMRLLAGANHHALERKFSEVEIYGLRPLELLMPYPGHRFEPFSSMGEYYRAHAAYSQGEMFSPYLGVLTGAMLFGLVWAGIRAMARNRNDGVPLPFWQTGWVAAYSVIGGGNACLAYFGIKMFRASNRYSIFIAAMVLMWAVPVLARRTRQWSLAGRLVAGIAVVGWAVADQLPPANHGAGRRETWEKMAADREFTALMESVLPHGASVFQLPAADFPEGYAVREMGAYEHLRPYLAGGHLRFSFGGNRGRMDAGWQFDVERMPPREMLSHLESLGFRGLMVNRDGFEKRGDRFLAVLQSLGYSLMAISEEHEAVFVPLKESPTKVEFDPHAYPVLDYGVGWSRSDRSADETDWICRGHADVTLNPAIPAGSVLSLEIEAGGPFPVRLHVTMGEELLIDEELSPEKMKVLRAEFVRPTVELPLVLRARPVDASRVERGALSFVVRRLELAGQ